MKVIYMDVTLNLLPEKQREMLVEKAEQGKLFHKSTESCRYLIVED